MDSSEKEKSTHRWPQGVEWKTVVTFVPPLGVTCPGEYLLSPGCLGPLMSWFGSWMMFIEHFCSLGMSAWRVANIWFMSSQLKHLTYQPPQKELNQYNPDGIQHAFNTGRFFLFPSLDVHRNKISGEKSYLLQCHSRRCKNWFRMRGVSFLIERRCYQPMRLHL